MRQSTSVECGWHRFGSNPSFFALPSAGIQTTEVNMDRDILQIVRQVCDVFEEIRIPYILGGCVAASPFGLSRLTKDIDIAARMRTEHVEPLVNALEAEYYIVAE